MLTLSSTQHISPQDGWCNLNGESVHPNGQPSDTTGGCRRLYRQSVAFAEVCTAFHKTLQNHDGTRDKTGCRNGFLAHDVAQLSLHGETQHG